MAGEALGRGLLRLDAVYCAGAGVIAVVLFSPLSRLLGTPAAVPAVAGALALGWALVLRRLAGTANWRRPVTAVASCNLLAAAAIGILAGFAPDTSARLLLAAVATEVAALAAGQVVAVRR